VGVEKERGWGVRVQWEQVREVIIEIKRGMSAFEIGCRCSFWLVGANLERYSLAAFGL